MLLAVSAMDPTVQFVFFLLAVIFFVLGALRVPWLVEWVALGLACFAFVFCWQALAAT